MIVLLEPISLGWMHEEVNAGFLQQICEATEEKIVYIGIENHIKCIRALFSNQRVTFVKIKELSAKMDEYQTACGYYFMINRILRKYHPKALFVLCGYRPMIMSLCLSAMLHHNIKFYMVLHAMVEKYHGKQEIYKKIFQYSQIVDNLKFISYSPYCSDDYWKLKKNKMIFLHHPYIQSKKKENLKKNKIIFGIIGAAANNNAKKFVKKMNETETAEEYEFWICSRFAAKFRGMKHVKILTDSFFVRSEMETLMSQIDYLVVLYGKSEYEVSASGILWDAVSNNVPCLMLESPYFMYYTKYNIGMHSQTINGLVQKFKQPIKKENYFTDMKELQQYNHEVLKKELL